MPQFGRHLRREWLIDPAVTYLNHGTVGAPPRRVIEHQRSIVDEIERHPARFVLRRLADVFGTWTEGTTLMRQALGPVGELLGARSDDLVFVDNITAGANAVLRSYPFEPGDELAVTSLGYGGITNAVSFAASGLGGTMRTIEMPEPGAPPQSFVDAVAAGLGERTRLLVVDHISANTGLVLPVADIARVCHDRDVLVFADGAHGPGCLAVDIEALGVDWYCGNLHKWAWAPRSCGVLWTAPEHQRSLHPTAISWGLGHGMAAEFDFPGTRDPSPFLTAPFAIALMREYGLDDVFGYNHDLVVAAAARLTGRFGVAFETPESMIASMATIDLPPGLGATAADAGEVRARLDELDIEVPIHPTPRGLAARLSAQIYCDLDDFDRFGDAIEALAAG